MSVTPYICGDDADEIRDAARSGIPVADIADQRRLNPGYLARLLQLRTSNHKPVQASDDIDIWAADRLNDVL